MRWTRVGGIMLLLKAAYLSQGYSRVLGRGRLKFRERRKAEVRRIPLPRTPLNKGTKKDRSQRRPGSGPSRSSAARVLLLGRRALVGRRGRLDRHSWQLRLGGLVVASLLTGRTLARRDELVDERERGCGRHAH